MVHPIGVVESALASAEPLTVTQLPPPLPDGIPFAVTLTAVNEAGVLVGTAPGWNASGQSEQHAAACHDGVYTDLHPAGSTRSLAVASTTPAQWVWRLPRSRVDRSRRTC
ncbi:hypothetical protein [Cryptosporangium minutisporangium]|uniref:Uncharacterized protein n=1 Tax=Cryptosporangium minutisporangium TaxID=113569 RepID=A0ABP6T921_9ACTN